MTNEFGLTPYDMLAAMDDKDLIKLEAERLTKAPKSLKPESIENLAKLHVKHHRELVIKYVLEQAH